MPSLRAQSVAFWRRVTGVGELILACCQLGRLPVRALFGQPALKKNRSRADVSTPQTLAMPIGSEATLHAFCDVIFSALAIFLPPSMDNRADST